MDQWYFVQNKVLLRMRICRLSFFSSVTQSCVTLCDPMDCSTLGFPVHHQLPELAHTQCSLSQWCRPIISSSVIPFSSLLQSFPISGSFLRSQFFTSSGQSIGASASTSVLPLNIEYWFPLGFTGWISLQSISWLQLQSAVVLEDKKIKSLTVSIVSPSACHEMMGLDTMILVFWMLSFQPAFSLSSFTFIKRLFSCALLSAVRVVSSVYLRLLIFLPAFLIPVYASSNLTFRVMYSAYKLNKQGDNT